MKFPSNIIAKKSLTKHSLKEESTNSSLNTVHSRELDEEVRTVQKSTTLTTSLPDMACQHQAEHCSICEMNKAINSAECSDVITVCVDINNSKSDEKVDLTDGCSYDSIDGRSSTPIKSRCSTPIRSRSNSNSRCDDDSGFNSCASDDKDDDCEEGSKSHCNCPQKSSQTSRISFNSALTSLPEQDKPLINIKATPENHKKIEHKTVQSRVQSSKNSNIVSSGFINNTEPERLISNIAWRSVHPRDHGSQDQNNNNNVQSKTLYAYLTNAPFKLQDCFQKNGFFTFCACIVYTILLAVIFGVLGIVLATVTSLIEKKDLKDLKEHIHGRRRGPRVVGSG